MNKRFCSAVKRALVVGVRPGSEKEDAQSGEELVKSKPSLAKLEQYAESSWNGLLDMMVGTETSVSANLVRVLVATGLLDSAGCMTNKGFQFLLRDVFSQLWILLLSYASSCQEKGTPVYEVLAFLFQLAFLQVGQITPTMRRSVGTLGYLFVMYNLMPSDCTIQPHAVISLSEAHQRLIPDLKEFGLLYFDKAANCFFPTSLGRDLTNSIVLSDEAAATSGATPAARSQHVSRRPGYIIVETNFRIYAYTTSPLQIKLLSLFAALQYRLPNLVVGKITRARVRESLENGITAQQILDFLTSNAHPQAKKRVPPVPECVSDQIILWEAERDRIKMEGCTVLEYRTEEKFKLALSRAKSAGIVRWSDEVQKILIIEEGTLEIVEQVKEET